MKNKQDFFKKKQAALLALKQDLKDYTEKLPQLVMNLPPEDFNGLMDFVLVNGNCQLYLDYYKIYSTIYINKDHKVKQSDLLQIYNTYKKCLAYLVIEFSTRKVCLGFHLKNNNNN